MGVSFIVLLFCLVSCNSLETAFSGKAEKKDIIGSWRYTKGSGSGIDLTLNSDNTYSYEEFGTKGQTLYKATGRYTLQGNTLRLRGIEEDEFRSEDYSVNIIESNNKKIMRLAATLVRTMDFYQTKAGDSDNSNEVNTNFVSSSESAKPVAETNINPGLLKSIAGVYTFDGGSVVINGEDVAVSFKTDASLETGKITALNGTTVSFNLGGNTYEAAYMNMNNQLTLLTGGEKIVLEKN